MKRTEVTYTKIFYADQLTDLKYQELVNFAVSLRDFKNVISKEVNSNLLYYMELSKFSFIKEMRAKHHKELSSYFDNALYLQVYTTYKNRFTAIQHKIAFKKREFKKIRLYKRATGQHKVGDLRSVVYKVSATPLSICLTYLARYGSETTSKFIKSQIDKVEESKQKFYANILRCIEKFGYDRLYSLAIRKRARIISHYQNPIEFKSLSFSGRSSHQFTNIIEYNKNRHSKISAFITLNVPFRKSKKLEIPVKLSHKAHGKPESYRKYTDKRSQYLYTVVIDELTKNVSVRLAKPCYKDIVDAGTSYIGIDVNVKHNLLSLSDGSTYDYNRKLVSAYIQLLNKVDAAKKSNPDYKPGRNRQLKLRQYYRQIRHSNERIVVQVCKNLKQHGINHVVMENLTNSFSRSYAKNEEFGEKYNRIASILNISSIKDEFNHIGENYNIAVSLVQSEYTSQMCPKCRCIDPENRTEQETFCCINCGHTDNADHNAAINIRNRVQETVFQNALLKSNPDGTYAPKNINHDKIKDILLRSSNCKDKKSYDDLICVS